MADITRRYETIIKLPTEFEPIRIRPFIPTPTEDDYKIGYIRRYFVQRVNDKNSVVYEISQSVYTSMVQNSLYNVINLNWKISGDVDEIKSINAKCVQYASKKLPAIMLYLPNLLQFSKNNI